MVEPALFPRRLPDLPVAFAPRQGSTEEGTVYAARVYRWRMWLDYDRNRATLGGPMQSYSSSHEVTAYQQWRDGLPIDFGSGVPVVRRGDEPS